MQAIQSNRINLFKGWSSASSNTTAHNLVSDLLAELSDGSPEDIIAKAVGAFGTKNFALVSSFGTESAVLLDAAARVDANIPVLMIDTGYLFPETLAYRDLLQARLRLNDLRTLTPDEIEVGQKDPQADLFQRDPDACCLLRKVRPLSRALADFGAWANGRKRYQSDSRAMIPVVEADGVRVKFNPLVNLSREDVVHRFRMLDLPYHPLEKFGFASIGCMPCTSRVSPNEDARSGRWRGQQKVECGLHTSPMSYSG